MEKCNCYHDENGKSECWGTRERDVCYCGGDEAKCDFCSAKRASAQAKKAIEELKKNEECKVTVTEYRKKNPDCEYCKHKIPPFNICKAVNKKMSKKQA